MLLRRCLPIRPVGNNVGFPLSAKHVVLFILLHVHNLHVWSHLVAPSFAVVLRLERHRLKVAPSALLVALTTSVLMVHARHVFCHVERTAYKLSKPAEAA